MSNTFAKTSRWIVAVTFVLAVWAVMVAAITFNVPQDASVAVFAPPGRAIDAISAANGKLIDAGRLVAIARSDDPDFVRKLYSAGAFLVVDARESSGCIGIARKHPDAMRL